MLLKLTKIRSYVARMKARGIAPADVLADSGLSEDLLTDPALLISPRQRERIVQNMLRLTRDPGLGLELGSQAQLVDFGILAHAQMTAPNLRSALVLWQKYSSAVGTTTAVELVDKGRNDWCIHYKVARTDRPFGRFEAEEITSMAVGLGPSLLGPLWQLAECTYDYRAPAYKNRYEEALGCPVRFSESMISVRIRSVSIDHPLPGHDPEFHELCLRYLDQFIRQSGRNRQTSERLRSMMLNQPQDPPDIAQAADYLGMSPRSLRRHLQHEGTSFSEQLNQSRLDLATRSLCQEGLPVKETAAELGYLNVQAFRRAFRGWTGKSIGEYLRTYTAPSLK